MILFDLSGMMRGSRAAVLHHGLSAPRSSSPSLFPGDPSAVALNTKAYYLQVALSCIFALHLQNPPLSFRLPSHLLRLSPSYRCCGSSLCLQQFSSRPPAWGQLTYSRQLRLGWFGILSRSPVVAQTRRSDSKPGSSDSRPQSQIPCADKTDRAMLPSSFDPGAQVGKGREDARRRRCLRLPGTPPL